MVVGSAEREEQGEGEGEEELQLLLLPPWFNGFVPAALVWFAFSALRLGFLSEFILRRRGDLSTTPMDRILRSFYGDALFTFGYVTINRRGMISSP